MKRRLSFRVAVACAALVLGLETTPATPAVAAVSSDGIASAYQLNAEHSGYAARGVAAPPLTRKWRRHLGGLVSYPLIADNKVFVTVRTDKGYRNVLRALDVRTGRDAWKPVELGGDYMSMITLGAGRVYALTHTGALAAHDMRTGKLLWWRQFVNHWAFTGPPTYRDGLVYVAGSGRGGAVYAIDAATGDITWSTNTASGDNSSPAVTADGVYTAHACARAYRLHPKTGALMWQHVTQCVGAGGRTPVVSGDSLWIRDNVRLYPDTALRLADGTVRTTYGKPGTPGDLNTLAPAFVGATGFFVTKGVLQARPAQTPDRVLWTFEGSRRIASAPIVVNGYLYVSSEDGRVYAVRLSNGRTVWSAPLGAPALPTDEDTPSAPIRGLGAGQGILAVPASNFLVAYGK